MDAVDRFAAEATLFQEWAFRGADQAECAVRAALIRLLRLYLAALELPDFLSTEAGDQPPVERVTEEECRAVAKACSRLPFDFYREVFDPFEEVLGDP